MNDDIIRGTITNTETGETTIVSHYPFFPGWELTTIAKIKHTDSYSYPNDTFQLSVDCEALDAYGFVYDLGLEFSPESREEMEQLAQDLTENSIFLVRGPYGMADNIVTLHEPVYSSFEPDFSESEIRKAFRFNRWSEKAENTK